METIPWYKQKTTWTAVAGIITAVGGYLVGEIVLQTMIEAVFACFMVVFMRLGVEKSKSPEVKDATKE